LEPGELVTAIDLPPEHFREHYSYLKLRDRLSYAFALVSVATALSFEDGKVADARVALGGVAHKPWRQPEAERILIGSEASERQFVACADGLIDGAIGRGANDFKIDLAKRAIVRALTQAAAGTPQPQNDKKIA
ncbi:xanthine dehydrogenase family protein subunit M, partial [Rhizobiaceae sp. 2RAB30]